MRSSAQIIENENNKVRLVIDIREDELTPFVDDAIKKIGRQARIPGFRPGKAPRKVLETRIGHQALRQQAIEDAVESYYVKALLENAVDSIAAPAVEVVDGRESGDVKIEAVVEVRPVVAVEGYGAIEVEVVSPLVTEDEIDDYINVLREQLGQLQEVDREIVTGDTVTADLVVKVGDVQDAEQSMEDLTFRVGHGQTYDEIEDAVVGHRVGEVVEVERDKQANDQESDQSQSEDDEARSDRQTFAVMIKLVKEMLLPQVDDDFVKEVSEFETVSQLREDVKSELQKLRSSRAKSSFQNELVNSVISLVEPKEIPTPLLNTEVEAQLHNFGHQLEGQGLSLNRYFELTGQSQQDFLNDVYGSASRNILFDLALRSIAISEGVEATEDEIQERLDAAVAANPAVAERARSEQAHMDTRVDILKEKAFKRLLGLVSIKDEKGNALSLADVDPDAAASLEDGSGSDDSNVDAELGGEINKDQI